MRKIKVGDFVKLKDGYNLYPESTSQYVGKCVSILKLNDHPNNHLSNIQISVPRKESAGGYLWVGESDIELVKHTAEEILSVLEETEGLF